MASLYDYLATLTYFNTSVAVVWSPGPASEAIITAAGPYPYVEVHEAQQSTLRPLYQNVDVESILVDVNIHQKASTTHGREPERDTAVQLWYDVRDAVESGNVTSWEYGQPLISLHRVTAMKPSLDERGGGLWGFVRFRAVVGPTGSGT